ncbi:MAG TPA: hypothetical protein VL069_01105 [Opitutus sp.]|nr:hypothetical protein [Opitutus sp.]
MTHRRSPSALRVSILVTLAAMFSAVFGTNSLWAADLSTWEQRLGPSAPKRAPAEDTRPTHFVTPPIKFVPASGKNIPLRVDPYQIGKPNLDKADYWSDSGQVAYVPDGSKAGDPGLMAVRLFAHYQGTYATAPMLDVYRGTANPDPETRNPVYVEANGGPLSGVVSQVRSSNTTGNDAFVLWENGLLSLATTQTGHDKQPWPWIKFPAHKKVQDLAVTSNNEFVLVALYDQERQTGQLAVIMIEAKGLPFHTLKQMGLPNQASVSAMKLLGYVDLPVGTSLRVSAACNGQWGGPSATAGKTLGQMVLTDEGTLKKLYAGTWAGVVANAGYAVVISRDENKAVVVDLSPLFKYVRESWLSSLESFTTTTAARAAGTWPATFEEKPELQPTVRVERKIERPVSVICGHHVDRWSQDRYKFHVGTEAGDLVIFDASPIMARFPWHKKGAAIAEMGRVFVGENPISLTFSRRNEGRGCALFPAGSKQKGDGENNVLWIACRKTRQVVQVITVGGRGLLLRTLEDTRLQDPVGVVVCVRGYVVHVCDFAGKQIIGFRIGTITDTRAEPDIVYPPAEGKGWEISGILPVPGYPHTITSENVN